MPWEGVALMYLRIQWAASTCGLSGASMNWPKVCTLYVRLGRVYFRHQSLPISPW